MSGGYFLPHELFIALLCFFAVELLFLLISLCIFMKKHPETLQSWALFCRDPPAPAERALTGITLDSSATGAHNSNANSTKRSTLSEKPTAQLNNKPQLNNVTSLSHTNGTNDSKHRQTISVAWTKSDNFIGLGLEAILHLLMITYLMSLFIFVIIRIATATIDYRIDTNADLSWNNYTSVCTRICPLRRGFGGLPVYLLQVFFLVRAYKLSRLIMPDKTCTHKIALCGVVVGAIVSMIWVLFASLQVYQPSTDGTLCEVDKNHPRTKIVDSSSFRYSSSFVFVVLWCLSLYLFLKPLCMQANLLKSLAKTMDPKHLLEKEQFASVTDLHGQIETIIRRVAKAGLVGNMFFIIAIVCMVIGADIGTIIYSVVTIHSFIIMALTFNDWKSRVFGAIYECPCYGDGSDEEMAVDLEIQTELQSVTTTTKATTSCPTPVHSTKATLVEIVSS